MNGLSQNNTTITVLFILIALSDYYVAEAQPNWDGKTPPCMLATPTISYKEDGPNVSTRDMPTDINEQLIVGYIKVPVAFENRGCIKKDGLGQANHTVPSDPGECYSACKTNLFGIYESDCYCFNKPLIRTPDPIDKCNVECSRPKHTVCGGHEDNTDGPNYISVYSYEFVTRSPTQVDNNCRAYSVYAPHFSWNDCNSNFNGICETVNSISFTLEGKRGGMNWKDYTNLCFKTNNYPASEASFQEWTPPLLWYLDYYINPKRWIGQTKSLIIVDYKNNFLMFLGESILISRIQELSLETTIHYGYVNLSKRNLGNTTKLMFTETKPSGRFLCLNVTDDTTTLSIPDTTTTTVSNLDTTTTTISKPEATKPTMPSKTDTTSPDGREYLHDRSRVHEGIIAAYVVVPIGVITIVIVVVFVIWKRRKHSDSTDSQYSDNHDNAQQPPSDLKTAVCNAAYDSDVTLKPLDPDDQRHDYFVLEAPSEYATIKAESIANSGEAEYDTTVMKNDWKHDSPGDGNVYNMLGRQEEDMYNHTDNGAGNKNDGEEGNTDGTYNHVVEDDAYSTTA